MTGRTPRPWEVRALREMDAAWLALMAEEARDGPIEAEPLSRETFAGMFGQ